MFTNLISRYETWPKCSSLFFWKVSVDEKSFVKFSVGAIFSDKYYILVELNLVLVGYLSGLVYYSYLQIWDLAEITCWGQTH